MELALCYDVEPRGREGTGRGPRGGLNFPHSATFHESASRAWSLETLPFEVRTSSTLEGRNLERVVSPFPLGEGGVRAQQRVSRRGSGLALRHFKRGVFGEEGDEAPRLASRRVMGSNTWERG